LSRESASGRHLGRRASLPRGEVAFDVLGGGPGRLGSRCPEPLIHLAQRGAPAERHAEYGGGDVPTDGPERADELASKAAEAALRAVEDNG
jgi:hypothetical protein